MKCHIVFGFPYVESCRTHVRTPLQVSLLCVFTSAASASRSSQSSVGVVFRGGGVTVVGLFFISRLFSVWLCCFSDSWFFFYQPCGLKGTKKQMDYPFFFFNKSALKCLFTKRSLQCDEISMSFYIPFIGRLIFYPSRTFKSCGPQR